MVIGLAPEKFDYTHMTKAFRLIKEQKAPLIAIHKARYMATSEGLAVGPGKILKIEIRTEFVCLSTCHPRNIGPFVLS